MINIKSQGDRIDVYLDKDADFSAVANAFREKVAGAKHFFDGVVATMSFKGRTLSDSEERHLLRVISTETTMRVTLVAGDDPPPPLPIIKKPKPKPVPVPPPPSPIVETPAIPKPTLPSVSPPNISQREMNTAYYRGGLRSGQTIKFDGSVVIVGDANPGSEIVATGNVIILGALKGMAHAGFNGDESCYVSAQQLQPTQLRIANLITYVPTTGRKNEAKPSIAYVLEGEVFIGQL